MVCPVPRFLRSAKGGGIMVLAAATGSRRDGWSDEFSFAAHVPMGHQSSDGP